MNFSIEISCVNGYDFSSENSPERSKLQSKMAQGKILSMWEKKSIFFNNKSKIKT